MADTIVLRTELRDGANVLAQLTQIDAKAKSPPAAGDPANHYRTGAAKDGSGKPDAAAGTDENSY